jgi:hypothetical protein
MPDFHTQVYGSVREVTSLYLISVETETGSSQHKVMTIQLLFCVRKNGKPEGKSPLGRPRRRWEDNITMIFRKLEGVVGTGWSGLRIGTGGGHL